MNRAVKNNRRSGWLSFEEGEFDFPFYQNQIDLNKWLFPIGGCVLSYSLFLINFPFSLLIKNGIRSSLALFFPLIGLYLFDQNFLRLLYRKVRTTDFKLIILTTFLAIIVQLIFYSIFFYLFQKSFNENGQVNILSRLDMTKRIIYIIFLFCFQLMAEEMLRVVPFLFFLYLSCQKFNLGRKQGVLISWVTSSLLFALFHLPTYNGDMIQICILFLGVFIMSFAYIKSKNIWVVFLVHVLYDFVLMAPTIFP